MIEALQEIDSIRLNFNNDGRLFLNLTIAFIMFGIALELKPDDFKKLFRSPKPALVGILSQFLLMPLLTFLLASALGDFITPTIGMGMILVSACPGGNISNFISSLAKGNVALSVSLTAFSSLGGLFLTPFNFAFWGNLYLEFGAKTADNALVQSLSVDAVDVLQTIVMILGIPLVLGIFVNLKFPRFTESVVQWIKRFSILVFIALIAIIFGSNFDLFLKYIKYIFLIVLVHNALALTMGFYTGRLFGLAQRESKTIAIETGIQNSGLALALLFNPDVFPQDLPIGGMAFIAAWWGVWHIISGLTIAGFWSGFSLKSTT
ncbi:MAG TPA: symporter [Flavobacteriales bacterium]|jgi:bile acid:Na+ symporter, BASS family|nr:bile acid:sodium symporter family protein [Flavobacteriales bacterium]HAW21407.1 symporter [Flavobacteriales bacterium]